MDAGGGLLAGGLVVPGVGVGDLAGVAVGLASGTGVEFVFVFASGLGVAVGFGVGVGVTGQSNRPLGVIVHPAGISCMNGLWPGGIFIV